MEQRKKLLYGKYSLLKLYYYLLYIVLTVLPLGHLFDQSMDCYKFFLSKRKMRKSPFSVVQWVKKMFHMPPGDFLCCAERKGRDTGHVEIREWEEWSRGGKVG